MQAQTPASTADTPPRTSLPTVEGGALAIARQEFDHNIIIIIHYYYYYYCFTECTKRKENRNGAGSDKQLVVKQVQTEGQPDQTGSLDTN